MIAPSVWFTVWRKYQRGEKAPEDFSFHFFFSSPRSSFAIRSFKSLHLTACCSATIVLISAMTHAWVWGVLIMSRKRVRLYPTFFPASARAERHRCDKFNPRSWCCCSFLLLCFLKLRLLLFLRGLHVQRVMPADSPQIHRLVLQRSTILLFRTLTHTHTHTHTELSCSQLAPAGTYK